MPRRNKAAPAPFESFAIASAETENGRQKFPVEVLSLIFSYASDAALFNALSERFGDYRPRIANLCLVNFSDVQALGDSCCAASLAPRSA